MSETKHGPVLTPEERAAKLAREICACTCHGTNPVPADNRGPLKDGSHYANCPAVNEGWAVADIAAAIREAVTAEREAAAGDVGEMASVWPASSTPRMVLRNAAAAIRARTP